MHDTTNETHITHLFKPIEQQAPADIAPARHRHALVQVLHQRVLCVKGERLDHARDVRRLGRVQDREECLEGQIVQEQEPIEVFDRCSMSPRDVGEEYCVKIEAAIFSG